MNLCKNCRWVDWYMPSLGKDNSGNAFCTHPTSLQPARTDRVTGQVTPAEPLSCTWVRTSFLKEQCGEAGQYWEPVEAGFR
jgi:hypothetical protein